MRCAARAMHGLDLFASGSCNHVGGAGGFDAGAHVVGADDVGTFHNERSLSSQRGVKAPVSGGILIFAAQHSSDKGFSRDSRQQRVAELVELVEAAEHGIVLLKILAE